VLTLWLAGILRWTKLAALDEVEAACGRLREHIRRTGANLLEHRSETRPAEPSRSPRVTA
jgi:hypothetical protein